jgi:hypothetical protein
MIYFIFSCAPPIKLPIPVENYTNGIDNIVVFCRISQFHQTNYINLTIVI